MVARLVMMLALLGLGGCLRSPNLRDCAEFPLGTGGDACGTPCDVYCDVLVDACPDEVPGENKAVACRSSCLEIPATGTFDDSRGNTLQCRIRAAVLAWDDDSHCPAAGFSGGEVCVDTPCDDYCSLMTASCPTMYQDNDQCLASCALFPRGVAGSGNSVECRTEAARQAGADANFCSAASLTSDGTCGTPCEGYCTQVMSHCTADQAIYADNGECLAACDLMAGGAAFDDWRSGGDSVQCRAWHASTPAELDPVTHCPHASLYNDHACGTTCDTWCFICGDQFSLGEECLAECAGLVESGAPLFPDPSAERQCR
ncbi:MAG: hypothetical protein R3F60_29190 [bacterium]